MLILALDTAFAATQMAIYESETDTCLAEESLGMATGHAETLMLLVERGLAEAGLAYSALERIAVTIGPGSFTGVRIALSAARALALALEIPVIGITTLAAFARSHSKPDQRILVALDARRGEIYAQLFSNHGNELSVPVLTTAAELVAKWHDGACPVIGSAATLVCTLSPHFIQGDTAPIPAIAAIARLGATAPLPQAPPTPLYLRAPDAKPQSSPLTRRS